MICRAGGVHPHLHAGRAVDGQLVGRRGRRGGRCAVAAGRGGRIAWLRALPAAGQQREQQDEGGSRETALAMRCLILIHTTLSCGFGCLRAAGWLRRGALRFVPFNVRCFCGVVNCSTHFDSVRIQYEKPCGMKTPPQSHTPAGGKGNRTRHAKKPPSRAVVRGEGRPPFVTRRGRAVQKKPVTDSWREYFATGFSAVYFTAGVMRQNACPERGR